MEDSRETLTVIVPCYDEERNIAATVADVLSYEDELPVHLQLLLVDDGSRDGTRAEMNRLASENEQVRVRINSRNLGVGRSVMNAYEDIEAGSWVTVIPGDNEFHFASVHRFLELRHDHDLILGYLQNSVARPLHRRLASHLFASSVRSIYGLPYRYLNGLKLYRLEVFKGLDVLASGHAYNAELVAKAILRNPFLRITEAPFIARGRMDGNTKAFRPTSIARAMGEFARGRVSVDTYRREKLGIDE